MIINNASLKNILDSVIATSKEIFGAHLESVVLYGSYARGDNDDQSDIDIMIIADVPAYDISKLSTPLRELCGELLFEYDTVVSICIQDSATFHRFANTLPFFMNIEREGVKYA